MKKVRTSGKEQTVVTAQESNSLHIDQVTMDIVTSLNRLIAKAQTERIATLKMILSDARDSIAWWASRDNYQESHSEKLVSQLTLDNGLCIALDFLAQYASLKDTEIKEKLLETLKKMQSVDSSSFVKGRKYAS